MFTLVLMCIGGFIFLVGTIILGIRVRKYPTKEVAEISSRISHSFYWFGLVLPGIIALFYPGLTMFDKILRIKPLPFYSAFLILGIIFLTIGIYFTVVSSKALRDLGKGAAAFKLTRQLVEHNIYNKVRNPMSLGYYLSCLGISMIAGSTFLTLGTLFLLIPTHAFNLKYFEEVELEIRYGESYKQYKQNVPFIIPKFFN